MTKDELDLARADDALATLLDRAGIQNELEAIKYRDQETWNEIRATLGRAMRKGDAARGLVVVPKQATEEMVESAAKKIAFYTEDGSWVIPEDVDARVVWRAMLAASPLADATPPDGS